MPIQNKQEFEDALSKLCRFYRALYDIWETAEIADKPAVSYWVRIGGKLTEELDVSMSDIEAYSGVADLRIVLSELKQMRAAKEASAERT